MGKWVLSLLRLNVVNINLFEGKRGENVKGDLISQMIL